jgi:hypothetical protein
MHNAFARFAGHLTFALAHIQGCAKVLAIANWQQIATIP